ncbi:MAG: transcription termination/antitermination factor NusG [Candidatus Cloacimonetes bacterium]|nr:transcription termination/antitermination factor NusG [Candidatus Cloacimonadota bacterium]
MTEENALPEDALANGPKARWYTMQVYTGQEEKVKRYVLEESVREGLADQILNVHIPTEKKVEMRGGKRKVKEVVNFPGYMFIEMLLTPHSTHFILNAPSVLNFVGPDNHPHPLSESEVKRIIGRIQGDDEAVLEISFKVGDTVRVVDGPFNDFTGTVQEINEEKKRLKVTVSIFGRSTPVELAFQQVDAVQ